jgi:MFS superfamily sulfate permease-like transporter
VKCSWSFEWWITSPGLSCVQCCCLPLQARLIPVCLYYRYAPLRCYFTPDVRAVHSRCCCCCARTLTYLPRQHFLATLLLQSIVAARKYAKKYHYSMSANRELIAHGSMNLMGSCFRSFPVFGSLSRTTVADAAGARSQLSGLVNSCVVLLCMLVLMQAFYYLPLAVIAAIVVHAALSLIELEDLGLLYKLQAYKEITLLLTTLVLTFVFGPETGIIVALLVSAFFVIKHTTMPQLVMLGKLPDSDSFRDISIFPQVCVLCVCVLRMHCCA